MGVCLNGGIYEQSQLDRDEKGAKGGLQPLGQKGFTDHSSDKPH